MRPRASRDHPSHPRRGRLVARQRDDQHRESRSPIKKLPTVLVTMYRRGPAWTIRTEPTESVPAAGACFIRCSINVTTRGVASPAGMTRNRPAFRRASSRTKRSAAIREPRGMTAGRASCRSLLSCAMGAALIRCRGAQSPPRSLRVRERSSGSGDTVINRPAGNELRCWEPMGDRPCSSTSARPRSALR